MIAKSKVFSITLLAICEIFVLGVWFSASAVVPSLRVEYGLTDSQASLLTSSVQMGFVLGTILSAILGWADRLDPIRYFMFAALLAAGANISILFFDPTSTKVIGLRFLTGMCMAGVYPIGIKIVASWARGDLGLLIGILIAALTLGSAAPHLLNAFGGADWRTTIVITSIGALSAAIMINFVGLGVLVSRTLKFNFGIAYKLWRKPAVRFANFGYLGHMWELYAMWAWLVVFLDASFQTSMDIVDATFWSRFITFFAIGVGGAVGCLFGGALADRYGRTALTMGAMSISATCALIMGFLFGSSPFLLTVVAFIWGASIIADSAQFSAVITELVEAEYVGTLLTMQLCLGFLLTLATVHFVPLLVSDTDWIYAFGLLAIGPIFGVWSMSRLRSHPDSEKIAGGRK